MTLATQLRQDMVAAMKRGEKDVVSTIRMVNSALSYAQIEARHELTEPEVEQVLRREVKKRREAAEAYQQAGRVELAEKEMCELSIIERYLPKQMGEGEIRSHIQGLLKTSKFGSFGDAMKAVMQDLRGKADGGTVSKVLRELMPS